MFNAAKYLEFLTRRKLKLFNYSIVKVKDSLSIQDNLKLPIY